MSLVIFPVQNLDMTPYVINSAHGQAVYDLLSVSNHYGGMGGGHCKYRWLSKLSTVYILITLQTQLMARIR